MASVAFEDIRKSFRGHEAVKGISLDIVDGEFVAFLGPSGCGKTTCLRMLAGLEEPTGGRIVLGGKDVTWEPPRTRDIAMVFQNYALYPHMTVRENLRMGLKYRSVPRGEIEKRIDDAAALLDIGPLLGRKPAELSGGQRQRVALGRAIVRQPKAFLMDEPLSNLDTALRARMRVELKLLHERVGTTTIYVTHDQIEAMTMADRIAVMSEGRLLQFDTPDQIFNEPANRFVAQFVGSPVINLLPARIAGAAVEALGRRYGLPRGTPRNPDTTVELGIRPQAVKLAPEGTPGLGNGRVTVIEPIGTQTHVHVQIGETAIVAVVEPRGAPRVGTTTAVTCDPADLYLFDGTDGRLLAHGLAAAASVSP